MRGDGEEDAARPVPDHPLARLQGEVGRAAQDNVHDGPEGVGRESLRGGDEVARRVVHHHRGVA